MKISKRILGLILLSVFSLLLVACGDKTDDNKPPIVQQYTVTFNVDGGNNVSQITREENKAIGTLPTTTKSGYMFDGWFSDSAKTVSVTGTELVTNNMTLYAKWIENRAYFLDARDKTVNSNQFEYDYDLSVTTKYSSINGPSAVMNGTVKYNENQANSYYKSQTNSGALLFDGQTHTIKTGTELSEFKVKPDGRLSDYERTSIPSNFKYESSSYAKVLFEYNIEQITEVIQATNNKYEIKYRGSTTGMMNTAIGFLNNPILKSFINVPETASDFKTYVTYKNGYIHTFEYEFSIDVVGASLTFSYELEFTKVGQGVTINPPTFADVAYTTQDVASKLSVINGALDAYRALENSGYTYDVKTEVDFPGEFAINAHTQGRTMRLVTENDVFFWNRVKFDSDYKNDDLYKSKGIVDYERYRVVYANGDVYDVQDRTWPLSNVHTKLTGYNNDATDNYYFLLDSNMLKTSYISVVQEVVVGNTKTYSLGLTKEGVIALLQFIDVSIRVDVNNANEILIYDVKSGLEIKDMDFEIILIDGKLSAIEIDINGSYEANAYVDTKFAGPASFNLSYLLRVNNDGNDYVAPTKDSEVVLSNS